MSDSGKNTLTIKLAEPVVYLKDVDFSGTRRTYNENSPPSMLRGLLILNLVKPTRISSIEIELQCKSLTTWPEGVRRMEVTEEHKIFSATTTYFRASETTSLVPRRAVSVDPGIRYRNEEHEDESFSSEDEHAPARGRPQLPERRLSADNSTFQRDFVSHEQSTLNVRTPSYSPSVSPTLSPASSISNLRAGNPTPSSSSQSTRPVPSSTGSQSSTIPSPIRTDESPGRALEDFRRVLMTTSERSSHSPSSPHGRSRNTSAGADSFVGRVSFDQEPYRGNVGNRSRSRDQSTPRSPVGSVRRDDDPRGRHNKRFSFNALFDRVRSHSPMAVLHHDKDLKMDRGRSAEKGKAKESKSAFVKVGEVLGIESEVGKEYGEGWKEFKKGTYTYPISFAIPADSPPSLDLELGRVLWRLKAAVHRPGTFRLKLSTTREVVVVACQSEDDMEDTENILVDRTWDDQMHYLMVISGRSFSIGGTIPVHMTFMPFSKMKIHRISIMLEEKVSYYTQMKQIARTTFPKRVILLSAKYLDKYNAPPILPLSVDDVNAFRRSPLYPLLINDGGLNLEQHPQSHLSEMASEMASSFMGPGPWILQFDAKLPPDCTELHPTNQNKKSNIIVSHMLKIVTRVERGDEAKDTHGRRKLFDIVIQSPVHILSCLCNPEHTSLPRYSEAWDDRTIDAVSCSPSCRYQSPTHNQKLPADSTRLHLRTLDSLTSSPDDVEPAMMPSFRRYPVDAVFGATTLYERLVTGQESEIGEAPPPYRIAARSRA